MKLAPEFFYALLALCAVQRIAELVYSRRNVQKTEASTLHASESRTAYAAMVLCHVLFFVLPALEVAHYGVQFPLWASLIAFVDFGLAQALRLWAIRSLRETWNVRAFIAEGQRVVTSGPYAYIRHPNYLAVLAEFVSVPLIGGAWRSMLFLNLIHLPVLLARIRSEERVLRTHTGWAEAMGSKPALFPRSFEPDDA
ncbi:MAG: isoprenylcysteine carboxylmethyltransferase family protein [Planctomycetota bacterium]